MSLPDLLYQRSEFLIVALLFVLLLAAAEFGFRRGRRVASTLGEATRSQLASLQTAVNTLLALLLGFTFAMAVSRFETRTRLVVDEANAIGTSALRARMLPAPYRETVLELFRKYLDSRLATYNEFLPTPAALQAKRQAALLQEEVWQQARQAAERNPSPVPTGLFIDALNQVFDQQAKRDAARDNHVPQSVLMLLFVVAILAMGLSGYGCGLGERRPWGTMLTVAVAISMVVLVIIDLDRPRRGLIHVSQQSMVDVRRGLDEPDRLR